MAFSEADDAAPPPACFLSRSVEADVALSLEFDDGFSPKSGPVSSSLKKGSSSGPLLPSIIRTLRPLLYEGNEGGNIKT